MEKNFVFVILGVIGDLAKLKLIPVIYSLLKLNVASKIAFIGIANLDVNI